MPYLCVDEGGEKVSPEQENEGEEADDCGAPTEHKAALRKAKETQVHHVSADPIRRVHFSTSSSEPTRMHVDDFMHAYSLRDEPLDMHIDYAHTIALGYHNQKYYLVIVIDGKDFMWASSTTTKKGPEELLEQFLRVTRIKIRRIHMDDAG